MSVRTRSSARRNSDASSLGDEEYDAPANGPPRRSIPPPPPPPPPPRLPPVQEVVRDDVSQRRAVQEVVREDVSQRRAAPTREPKIRPWTLKVRAEPRGGGRRRNVVRIYMTPRMQPASLAECIQQTCDMDSNEFRESIVAGLFRESDCIFFSLDDILAERDEANVYSLTYPYIPKPKPKPWYTEPYMIVALIASVLVALWRFGPTALTYLHYWSGELFELIVNEPLRELYRYGPSLVGWEGASLPSVCARITYHGDETFWKRNMDECQNIYSNKEEAMLRTVRPLFYLAGVITGFWAIRALVREHALVVRDRKNHLLLAPDHRDMVDTYHAFNVLFRQMSRAMNDKQHHHQPQQQH